MSNDASSTQDDDSSSSIIRVVVDKYLSAIDLSECQEPTYPYLCEIVWRHVNRFPFSSVIPRMQTTTTPTPPLDLPSIYEQVVVQKRGGYCFQQNKLLHGVLEQLGYKVHLVMACVTNNRPHFRPGFTHRVTVVDLLSGEEQDNSSEQQYIVDVAFGEKCPPVPVPLCGRELSDGKRTFRVFHANDHHASRHSPCSDSCSSSSINNKGNNAMDPDPFHMQVRQCQPPDNGASEQQPLQQEQEWFTTYKFDLGIHYSEIDCDVGHFYMHNSPDSVFVKNLVVCRRRRSDGLILNLINGSLHMISPHHQTDEEEETATVVVVASPQHLRTLLREEFDLRITKAEGQLLFDQSCLEHEMKR